MLPLLLPYRYCIGISKVNKEIGNQYEKLTASTIFSNSANNGFTFHAEKQQLTKEEQLLRERKRCSLSGITSYFVDCHSGRLVFSERSDLFYFNDEIFYEHWVMNLKN